MTDAVDTQDAEGTDGNDSSVIKALRAREKELAARVKELEGLPSRSEVEAHIRSVVEREQAIESQLVGLGQPPAVRKLIEDSLDGEITAEAVAEAVEAQGFQITTQESKGESQDLGDVTKLGNQVANAATGNEKQSLNERINNAGSAAEVAAIMAEAEANGEV